MREPEREGDLRPWRVRLAAAFIGVNTAGIVRRFAQQRTPLGQTRFESG